MNNSPNDAEVIRRTTGIARTIFGALAITTILIVPFFILRLEALRLYSAYALALLVPCIAVCSAFLITVGPKLRNWVSAVFGILYVAGGAAFDITATLLHSPELVREDNLVARALLDKGGHGLLFMYVYGFTLQFSVVFFVCMFWLCFLKQKDVLIASVIKGKPGSFEEFLKAATGAEGMSRRQWFFPMRISEFPRAYNQLFVIAVLATIGGPGYRWWLGLEWFRWVEHGSRAPVAIGGVIAGLGFYTAWVYHRYCLYKQVLNTGPGSGSVSAGTLNVLTPNTIEKQQTQE